MVVVVQLASWLAHASDQRLPFVVPVVASSSLAVVPLLAVVLVAVLPYSSQG